MSDQIVTKQVTWEDMEVAKEQNENISHSELARMRGVIINVSLDDSNKFMEQVTQDLLVAMSVPVYRYAVDGQFVEVGHAMALCTPGRDPLTGHMEEQ